MANIYKKINTDLITATENTVYTVPNNSRALVKSIHIFNEGAGSAALTLKIESDGTDYFYDKKDLAADAKEEFVTNILVLQENDKLKFISDITGPDVTVSLLELNRPFIETKERLKKEIINGKEVITIVPETEVTLKNLKTGKEYMSDAEALADVQDSKTETKAEDVSRSVHIKITSIPLGTTTGEF